MVLVAQYAGRCQSIRVCLFCAHPSHLLGLSKPQGNTVILVVVARFLKACHLIPFPKIPTKSQMADLLMQHIFRIQRFPQDMVSD